MGILLLFLSLGIKSPEPEDYCETYILEKNLATPSPLWDRVYDSSYNGFLTTQGSLDEKRWYLFYKAKTEFARYKRFKLRYRYYRLADYNDFVEIHRFEPTIKIWRDFYSHLVIVPTFNKGKDRLGFGFSYFLRPIDYIEAFLIIKDLEHNTVSDTPYTKQPYILKIEFSKKWEWGRVKGYFEYTTPWEKPIERGVSFKSDGRIETKAFYNSLLGSIWEYNHSLTSKDTLNEFMMEPFFRYPLIKRLFGNLQYRWEYKRHTSYYRIWDGLSLLFEYSLSSNSILGIGYQQSLRRVWIDNLKVSDPQACQKRLILSFEFRPPHSFLVAKEALDLDKLRNVWNYFVSSEYHYALAYLHDRTYFGLLFHF